MSNFTGVTFAQQKVLPSDDAIIRRKILSDGVLYGCELTYSGSTLTRSAGQLLICGRQIRHPAAQNWAISDATSGFARLVLTVDLTRTATKDTFDQVPDTIQYATSKDGFPELNQADVNTTGSVYQIAACVVSLGPGGITGIVDSIGPCEVSGGGGLNFKVVGGLTQPAGLAENDIWVITDFEITGYDFSATQSTDPVEGMVWISTGTSSSVAFSATKKNPVMVYPLAAKQYISGAWVDKEAKSYQDGAWVDWIRYFLKGNNVFADITGGWVCRYASGNVSVAEIREQGLYTKQTSASGAYFSNWFTVNKVDVTDIRSITAKLSNNKTGLGRLGLHINNTDVGEHDFSVGVAIGDWVIGDSEIQYDVSNVTGAYYIKLTYQNGDGADVYWTEVRGE